MGTILEATRGYLSLYLYLTLDLLFVGLSKDLLDRGCIDLLEINVVGVLIFGGFFNMEV